MLSADEVAAKSGAIFDVCVLFLAADIVGRPLRRSRASHLSRKAAAISLSESITQQVSITSTRWTKTRRASLGAEPTEMSKTQVTDLRRAIESRLHIGTGVTKPSGSNELEYTHIYGSGIFGAPKLGCSSRSAVSRLPDWVWSEPSRQMWTNKRLCANKPNKSNEKTTGCSVFTLKQWLPEQTEMADGARSRLCLQRQQLISISAPRLLIFGGFACPSDLEPNGSRANGKIKCARWERNR